MLMKSQKNGKRNIFFRHLISAKAKQIGNIGSYRTYKVNNENALVNW